jgi:hypothetical protein
LTSREQAAKKYLAKDVVQLCDMVFQKDLGFLVLIDSAPVTSCCLVTQRKVRRKLVGRLPKEGE